MLLLDCLGASKGGRSVCSLGLHQRSGALCQRITEAGFSLGTWCPNILVDWPEQSCNLLAVPGQSLPVTALGAPCFPDHWHFLSCVLHPEWLGFTKLIFRSASQPVRTVLAALSDPYMLLASLGLPWCTSVFFRSGLGMGIAMVNKP